MDVGRGTLDRRNLLRASFERGASAAAGGEQESLLGIVATAAETPGIARLTAAFRTAVAGAFSPIEGEAERAEEPLRHSGERCLSRAAVADAGHGAELSTAALVPDGWKAGAVAIAVTGSWQVACSAGISTATVAVPEAPMAVSRIALISALVFLAITPVDAGRPWPASAPAVRSRVTSSRRPARHDPEEGVFLHAISRGSHRRASIERA
jgi:hypothetical protein